MTLEYPPPQISYIGTCSFVSCYFILRKWNFPYGILKPSQERVFKYLMMWETDRKGENMNVTNLPVYVLCCTVIILNFIRAKTASIRRYTIILCANIQEKILPYKLWHSPKIPSITRCILISELYNMEKKHEINSGNFLLATQRCSSHNDSCAQ